MSTDKLTFFSKSDPSNLSCINSDSYSEIWTNNTSPAIKSNYSKLEVEIPSNNEQSIPKTLVQKSVITEELAQEIFSVQDSETETDSEMETEEEQASEHDQNAIANHLLPETNTIWIDSESLTDSLRNFADQQSMANHFQDIFNQQRKKISSKKKKNHQRNKLQNNINSLKRKRQSFSLSPIHNYTQNHIKNEIICDHNGLPIFSTEDVHIRRLIKRRNIQKKIKHEKEKQVFKECTFSPNISNIFYSLQKQNVTNRNRSQPPLFDKLLSTSVYVSGSESISPPVSPLVRKRQKSLMMRLSTPKSKKTIKHKTIKHKTKDIKSVKYFASPNRVREISHRLHSNYNKIRAKKILYQQNLIECENELRSESKVLQNSRRIILNAFLRDLQNTLRIQLHLPKYYSIKNIANFTVEQIEKALTEVGFGYCLEDKNTVERRVIRTTFVKKLFQMLDRNDEQNEIADDGQIANIANTISWKKIKYFCMQIVSNPNQNLNKKMYRMMRNLHTQKLFNKACNGNIKLKKKKKKYRNAESDQLFILKRDKEIERRHRRTIEYEKERVLRLKEKQEKEFEECTFTPQINRSNGMHLEGNSSCFNKLYDDAMNKNKRLNKRKNEIEHEKDEEFKSYFVPHINDSIKMGSEHLKIAGYDKSVLRMSEARVRTEEHKNELENLEKKLKLAWENRRKYLKKKKEVKK